MYLLRSFFFSGPLGAVLSYKGNNTAAGWPKTMGSRGWVRRALTISVFHSSQSVGKRILRRRDLTMRWGGSPSHGLAAFLYPTYTTDEEAMRWGGSPSHGIAALPLSTLY